MLEIFSGQPDCGPQISPYVQSEFRPGAANVWDIGIADRVPDTAIGLVEKIDVQTRTNDVSHQVGQVTD